MAAIDLFFALKILHLGALIFWLGPSLGAWFVLLATRKYLGEITPAAHLAYRIFIKLLVLEHIAFIALIGSGLGMAYLVFGFDQPWLQWKLLIILLFVLPLEILDIWYGNIKLPQIFARFNEAGYDPAQTRTLHIYHVYVTRAAIAIIPASVLAIMWLVIVKPNLPPL